MKKINFTLLMLLISTISFTQQVFLTGSNFDLAAMPPGWTTTNLGGGGYDWVLGETVIPGTTNSFPNGAAIFDDDSSGNDGMRDHVRLSYIGASDTGVNVSAWGQVTLTYDYTFVKDGIEKLAVVVYNNDTNTWIEGKVYTTDQTTPFSDSLDITALMKAYPGIDPYHLKFGFEYDDLDGSWGYGAGVNDAFLWGSLQPAHDNFITHTTTSANVLFNRTYIDHASLNNNPDAKILATHNYGLDGPYNTSPDGVFYDSDINKWGVFNEDSSVMEEGLEYNIYIRGNDSNVITHIVTPENLVNPVYTIIDNPVINNDPNAILVMDNYFNPNAELNNKNYGFFFNGTNWGIYSEDNSSLLMGIAFNVIISPSNDNVVSFKHQSTIDNTIGNVTTIFNPLLNGKHNAVFVFSHNWGSSGDSENVIIDKQLGVWYNGINWTIYTEDQSAMPINAAFNIVVMNSEVVAVDSNDLVNFNIYPNPVQDNLIIESQEEITKVTIYNLLGQEVKSVNATSTNIDLDVSNLDTGIYIIKLVANNKTSSSKFIKK